MQFDKVVVAQSEEALRQCKWRVESVFPGLAKTYQFKRMRLTFTHDPKSQIMAQAWRASSVIELNLFYWNHAELMLGEVMAHEIGHIIAPLIYGEKGDGHTPEWEETVKALGYNPQEFYELEEV